MHGPGIRVAKAPVILAWVSALLLVLALPSAAGASQGPRIPQVRLQVGKVSLSAPDRAGRSSLLVPIDYPMLYANRPLPLTVLLTAPGIDRTWRVRPWGNAGPRPTPVRVKNFLFVHRIELGPRLSTLLRRASGVRVTVLPSTHLDVNADGKPDLLVLGSASRSLYGGRRGVFCSDLPQLGVKPGQWVSVPLPACDRRRSWSLSRGPEHGRAGIRGGRLVYRAPKKFRGSDQLGLLGAAPRGAEPGSHSVSVAAPATVKVGTAQGAVVRAMGDSVTAGFGYFHTGTPMPLEDLLECKPGEKFYDDACSSNSIVTSNAGSKIEYAPDYGLANDVSWAAQWSNEHGISNYENLAVSGSEPKDWAPGGQLHAKTAQVEAEDPDYVLITVGANPILSDVLFGLENMGCAISADVLGGYRECVEEAFAEVHLQANLAALYRELVKNTEATIYLMQYHLAIPSTALVYSATQIAEIGKLMNREIATIAAAVEPKRLRVVAPLHFNVGIDISPVYPSRYSCSRLGYRVDGPSVQIEATQDELLLSHPLSFCEGPERGPPWVISGDTGIHPSAAGYEQMASQVPAPE